MKNKIISSEVLDNLSHDLRTPLNAILGYSQLLSKSENLTEDQKSHVRSISKGGQELLEVINDMLDQPENSSVECLFNDQRKTDLHSPPKNKLSLLKQESEIQGRAEALDSPKALIVDDLVMNRTLARIMLQSRNFVTVEAENGKEAVELYHKQNPDLILMDISMPVLNGVAAMRQIKDSRSVKDQPIPIIAITAGGHAGSRSELMEKGFSEYIQKPFNEEELINKISMFLTVPVRNLNSVSEA